MIDENDIDILPLGSCSSVVGVVGVKPHLSR